MTTAYIGLGANLGEAAATLQDAVSALEKLPLTRVDKVSSFYRTAPVDAQGPDYINAVARLNTKLAPHDLLSALQTIENMHGRQRPYKNAPRTLDLDILLFGDLKIADTQLTVPHPRMHQRAFVLEPLAELHPTLRLPQGTLSELIEGCRHQAVQRLAD